MAGKHPRVIVEEVKEFISFKEFKKEQPSNRLNNLFVSNQP
jgi:hypothetical protein